MIESYPRRPSRPLGVALAILTSVFLFTLLPMMQVGLVVVVQQHFATLNFPDSGPQPIEVGGDFLGVSPVNMLIQGVLALAFLVIAVLAWRGRPARIRYIFVGAVIGLTLIKIGVMLVQVLSSPDFVQGYSSLDSLTSAFGRIQAGFELLVMTYVVWYLNRGPARAFYRGYFLPPHTPDNSPTSG
jgi:hypothetical protein